MREKTRERERANKTNKGKGGKEDRGSEREKGGTACRHFSIVEEDIIIGGWLLKVYSTGNVTLNITSTVVSDTVLLKFCEPSISYFFHQTDATSMTVKQPVPL